MVVSRSMGKAVVELDLDDRDFKRETGRATAGLDSQMGQLRNTVMGVVAALGLVAAAKGAVNMLTTLTKKAIEVADSFDMMEKQLITLTKSEPKARAFFEAIKEFAKDTPYQVRDLAQSFNMLYPVFKDETIPMMKLIGDTAAGTGRSFEDTASAMMRMATGDWGVEIMRQLFLVKADFGDLFGPTGTLVGSQEEAFGKLEEILGDRFGGMMVGMMDTVQGKVSNLKDVLDSLANSVGVELTPVTKELLDLLIEAVKRAEESGELKEAAKELAAALRDNKDILEEIITDSIPVMIDGLATVVSSLGALVEILGKANTTFKEVFGESAPTAVEILNEVLRNVLTTMQALVWAAEKYAEVQTLGAYKSRSWGEITGGGAGGFFEAPESGKGLHGRIGALLEAGMSPEDIEAYARTMGASEADIEYAYSEYARVKDKEKPPPPGGKKGKAKKPLTYEQRLATARGALAEVYHPTEAGEVVQEHMTPEERRKAREEEQKEVLEDLKERAEFLMEYMDPSRAIIEGLRSGDMKTAMQNFAIDLGARVTEELLHAIFMKGLLALLNIASGGATSGLQLAMGRGGVIKAAQGLVGVLPPRPGGWMIPFGDKMINAAEVGQPEVAAFLPPGRRGQDIVLNKLMPMFNIRPQVEANFETRPQNNVVVKVEHADRHHVRAHNEASAGKVNKAVNVRQ